MSEPNYAKLEADNPRLDKEKPCPLAEILVMDFTYVLLGPTCTRVLANAGARVIHIERKIGDDTRHTGSHIADGSSEYFRICDAGKESITSDLKDSKDHALAEEMIAKTDAVMENFRPGMVVRLSFDLERMVEKYSRLIFVSVSGFGQYGPWLKQAAYDTVIQAVSGLMGATGEPNDKPTHIGISVPDVVAGVMGYNTIATALVVRECTGKGTTIDVPMLDSTFSLMVQDLVLALGPRGIPHRIGNRHPDMYPFDVFDRQD